MNNFDICIAPVLVNEGVDSNHPQDPGGVTRYGISKRAFPNLDIASLTLEQAKALYRKFYWDANNMDEYPLAVAFELFDCAVNCGAGTAIRIMQRSLDIADDGHVGPITMAAVKKMNANALANKMLAGRVVYYTKLSGWATFGKGWINRLANNLIWRANHV